MKKKDRLRQRAQEGEQQKQAKPEKVIAKAPVTPLSPQVVTCLTLAAIALAYILVFYGRYILLPWWDNPGMQYCGEPAQTTNDVYSFIAGADGFGRAKFEHFSTFIWFFHKISGANYGVLGIWLPVILPPLIVIPVCWLFALIGHPFAGVVASVFMLNSPSFFARTIPGYYDNDMLDLFFPIGFIAAIFITIHKLVGPDPLWIFGKRRRAPAYNAKMHVVWLYAALAGFWPISYALLYGEGRNTINFGMLIAAIIASLFLVSKQNRNKLLGALSIIGLAVMIKIYFLPIAFVAILVAYFDPEKCEDRKIGYYLLGGFILSFMFSGDLAQAIIERVLFYSAGGSTIASVRSAIPVPSFSVSVSEIQRVPFDAFADMSAYNMPSFILGCIGTILLLVIRPATMALAFPFALGMSSIFLGVRFAIFACFALGIGITFLLAEVTTRVFRKRFIHIGVYTAIALAICAFTNKPGAGFHPILNKEYAESLCQLRGKAGKDAQFWAWWDWGHPISYYARVLPFVDGGINELGCYITAVVHTTNSTKTASSIMKYTVTVQMINAMHNAERAKWDKDFAMKFNNTGYNEFQPMVPIHYLNNPDVLDKTLHTVLASMKEKPGKIPPQYLAFTWDNVRFFHWVGYFGKWDTQQRRSTSPQIVKLPTGTYPFDPKKGILTINNKSFPLTYMDVIDAKGLHRIKYPNDQGYNLIKNDLTGDLYIADNTIHRSLMYRMLVEDPRQFSDHFEIVADRFPMARIYRLKV